MKGHLVLTVAILSNLGVGQTRHLSFEVEIDTKADAFNMSINEVPLMNNIGYLLKGYDIFHGNPMPTGKSLHDPGYRQMIFDARYSGQTTADKRYQVPDGVELVKDESCSYSFGSSFITGQKSYSESLGIKASVQGSFLSGSFSASADYRHVEQSTSQGSSLFTHAEASCLVYSGNVKKYDHPPFSRNFEMGIKNLPKEYNESKYWDFLVAFGTHFVKSASMGSLFGQQSRMTTESYSKLVETGVDVSVSAKYCAIEASVDVDYDKKAAENFKKETNEQSIYSRGSRPPKKGKVEDWLHQTFQDPNPINIQLAPIYDLEDLDDTIRGHLKTATETYCHKLRALGALDNCDKLKPDPPLPKPRLWTKWSHDNGGPGEIEYLPKQCPDGHFITSIRFRQVFKRNMWSCLDDVAIKCSNEASVQTLSDNSWDGWMDCTGKGGFKQLSARVFDRYTVVNAMTICTGSSVEMISNPSNLAGGFENPLKCQQDQKMVAIQLKGALNRYDKLGPRAISNIRIQCA